MEQEKKYISILILSHLHFTVLIVECFIFLITTWTGGELTFNDFDILFSREFDIQCFN